MCVSFICLRAFEYTGVQGRSGAIGFRGREVQSGVGGWDLRRGHFFFFTASTLDAEHGRGAREQRRGLQGGGDVLVASHDRGSQRVHMSEPICPRCVCKVLTGETETTACAESLSPRPKAAGTAGGSAFLERKRPCTCRQAHDSYLLTYSTTRHRLAFPLHAPEICIEERQTEEDLLWTTATNIPSLCTNKYCIGFVGASRPRFGWGRLQGKNGCIHHAREAEIHSVVIRTRGKRKSAGKLRIFRGGNTRRTALTALHARAAAQQTGARLLVRVKSTGTGNR